MYSQNHMYPNPFPTATYPKSSNQGDPSLHYSVHNDVNLQRHPKHPLDTVSPATQPMSSARGRPSLPPPDYHNAVPHSRHSRQPTNTFSSSQHLETSSQDDPSLRFPDSENFDPQQPQSRHPQHTVPMSTRSMSFHQDNSSQFHYDSDYNNFNLQYVQPSQPIAADLNPTYANSMPDMQGWGLPLQHANSTTSPISRLEPATTSGRSLNLRHSQRPVALAPTRSSSRSTKPDYAFESDSDEEFDPSSEEERPRKRQAPSNEIQLPRKGGRRNITRTCNETPIGFHPTTQKRFVIDSQGNRVTFKLDGTLALSGKVDLNEHHKVNEVYKRNFFQVSDCHYIISANKTQEESDLRLCFDHGAPAQKVQSLSIKISAHSNNEDGFDVGLERFPNTSRDAESRILDQNPRNRAGNENPDAFTECLAPSLPATELDLSSIQQGRQTRYFLNSLSVAHNSPTACSWERTSFQRATMHNGERRNDQSFHVLCLSLMATLENGIKHEIAVRTSPKFIVLARSPAGIKPKTKKEPSPEPQPNNRSRSILAAESTPRKRQRPLEPEEEEYTGPKPKRRATQAPQAQMLSPALTRQSSGLDGLSSVASYSFPSSPSYLQDPQVPITPWDTSQELSPSNFPSNVRAGPSSGYSTTFGVLDMANLENKRHFDIAFDGSFDDSYWHCTYPPEPSNWSLNANIPSEQMDPVLKETLEEAFGTDFVPAPSSYFADSVASPQEETSDSDAEASIPSSPSVQPQPIGENLEDISHDNLEDCGPELQLQRSDTENSAHLYGTSGENDPHVDFDLDSEFSKWFDMHGNVTCN